MAEQACDERALLQTGDRESYAQALLDMAQAVRRNQGRLAWQGIATAKETQVKKRIDQILDDTRHISGALSPARWVALFVLSLPPVYLLTAVQIVPAQAQTQSSERPRQVSFTITKEEFDRRVAYANEHFAGDVPGSKTDRGRMYIQHGPPDEIESHPNSLPPFDKWRYHHLESMGDNIDTTFTDVDGTRNYRLDAPPSPRPVTTVDPLYPAAALGARMQGIVRFRATIGKDGHIENLQLLMGHPLLVNAAQEAVRQWIYQPALQNGQPVEVVTQVDVPFR